MARYSHPSFDFYPDSKPSFPEDDDMSVLDDKILDTTEPSLSSSHRDSVWSDFSPHQPQPAHQHPPRHPSHLPPQPFFDSTPSHFMRVDGPHPSYNQQPSWSLKESGSCTPTAMYDHYPSDLDHNSSAPFSGGAVGPVNPVQMPSMSYRSGMAFPASGAVAMSPQSSQGWIPAATDMPDALSRPTKSPTYRNSSPLSMRRDGIRKKNARFEIPAERTLSNIDQLISQSTNEDEIKELKQQKRLLRNRQAALDSRQRKKLHTEKLEEEKKQFTQVIGDLEEELQNMRLREAELLREKSEWMAAQQEITHFINSLHMEKDEMIRVHTLETADLRKKNNILKETIEKLERHARPSNMATDFSDFDNLTMDNTPWEDFTMVNSLSLDAEPVATAPAPSSTMVISTTDKAPEKSNDYPFSWNAFYMCLLFGAFIASNNVSLSSRALPQLSEEYRAESANVLKAVLASSPPELASSNNHPAPAPSATPMPTTITGVEMAQMATGPVPPSTLDELHNTLAMPTKEQEQEQAFSLNADQYNSLTTFEDTGVEYKQQQPSNLQQALAAMRSNAAQNRLPNKATSDVYSRSLMWDHVPEKVIRDFRRMVQEFGATPVKEEGFAHP
ncbi:hypothetical protein BDV59DRAFT_92072 [Aspergillus ambiguus]|uniref:putative bZIP transcription factor n=1 Tax=Aspergillus ambiguus TaxID=176160 RepID=UPI003CCD8FF3